MKNNDYWKQRFKQLEAVQNQQGTAVYLEIEKQYRRAQREIQGKINTWYQRLADNNGISIAEARKWLSGNALKEFRWDVQDYIKYGKENALNGKWIKELENASAKFHISRMEALKLQVQQSLEVMFGNQIDSVDTAMKRIYLGGYYHTAYELQKGFKIGWDIAGLDQAQIEKVIRKPWALDGKNFSERIWSSKEKLISEVHKELTQNIMLGQDPQKAIDAISKKMHTSKNNAGRLVMTEEAYFSSAAQKDCFNDLDIEKYEIVATLDSHTSQICQDLDGQVFIMKDFEPGITAPPFHPYCRSTTVPYFDEDFDQIGERAARKENGKVYYVPADMTYKEWQEKFVDSNGEEAENKVSKEDVNYLVRSHTTGQAIESEQKTVEETILSMPKKVQDALGQGTIIDIGKKGASQYDYTHDILYVSEGADKTAIIHEIGHMVENKLLKAEQVTGIRKKTIKSISIFDLDRDIFLDSSGNEKEIFFVKNNKFVSDYQGRIYVDNLFDAFETDGVFKDDLLWEYVSEAFREYIENPDVLKMKDIELYNLIMGAVE